MLGGITNTHTALFRRKLGVFPGYDSAFDWRLCSLPLGAKMGEIRIHIFVPVLALGFASTSALASPGDVCRKEICDSVVEACMRTHQSLNPLAATATEKKSFCDTYFNGCMRQYVPADVPWYSPDTVARFLQCPQ